MTQLRKGWIGIDPGKTGAIALISDNGSYRVWDFPGTFKGVVEILDSLLASYELYAMIEAQQAMPKQGVTSVFSLGENYGTYKGILFALGIRFREVRPVVWKKGYVPPKSDKAASVDCASKIFPKAELYGPKGGKKDGRAEALLLADYSKREWRM